MIVLNLEPYLYSEKAVSLWERNNFKYFEGNWKTFKLKEISKKAEILIVRLSKKIDKETLNNFKNPHQIIVTDDVKCFTNTDKDLIELTYKRKLRRSPNLDELPTKDKKYVIDLKTLNNVVNDHIDERAFIYSGLHLFQDDNPLIDQFRHKESTTP